MKNQINQTNLNHLTREKSTTHVLCLNPCVDRWITLDEPLLSGGLYRTHSTSLPGGKGISVARALSRLGGSVTLTAFLGGPNGELIQKLSKEEALPLSVVQTGAETRSCLKITDGQGQQTEINEEGGPITQKELEELTLVFGEKFSTDFPQSAILCGSIPQGVEKDVYNLWITLLKGCGARVLLDSSGEALLQGLEARPDVIKPNLSELFQLFKAFHPFSPYEKMTEKEFSTSKKDVEFAAELFHSYGTEILCTKGAEGSFFQGECGLVQISSHPIQANSFAGAGDVFLAAFHRFSPVRTDNRQVIQAAMEFATEAALQRISLSKGAFPDFVDLRKKIEAIEIEKNKK